jgi:predicted TIM-barrel fold metal-dependent hydrolase
MDSGIEGGSKAPLPPIDVDSDTRDVLAHAAKAKAGKFADYFIVDIDSHHNERASWNEIVEYIADPVKREIAREYQKNSGSGSGYGLNVDTGLRLQDVGGRIPHQTARREKVAEKSPHRDTILAQRAYQALGVDYTVMFPTPMLFLGVHPNPEMEVLLGRAYNAWLCDRILADDDRLKAMIFLPFNDPKASLETVKEFAGRKGVIGFMITSTRYARVQNPDYMPLYAELEARGLPLGFHASSNWGDRGMSQLNSFIGMHAVSFALCNIIHMTNWVLNGMQERFPKLDVIWIESGLAWLPFLMQRLDNEYLMRSSECPLLKKLPSEYMRDMFYSCQPMERTNMKALECTFEMINAPTQLLYSSDWPHWDFDTPDAIFDLPFLDEEAKRNILGLNAKRLFRL